MGEFDARITHRMRDRMKEILVAGGQDERKALDEANSLSDGLGYYHRVTASTGLHFRQAFDGIEVVGGGGDVIELIAYDRLPDYD